VTRGERAGRVIAPAKSFPQKAGATQSDAPSFFFPLSLSLYLYLSSGTSRENENENDKLMLRGSDVPQTSKSASKLMPDCGFAARREF
jgi:hypothetical protein